MEGWPCIGLVCQSLAKLTDPSHVASTFTHYFDEVYGDLAATTALIHKQENVMLHLDYNEKIKTVKTLDVSTKQLKRSFFWGEDDAKFVDFQKYVNDTIKSKNWICMETGLNLQHLY